MAGCLSFFAADGRGPILLGNAWWRAAQAFLALAPSFASPQLFVDLPLAGDPCCDIHIGFSELCPQEDGTFGAIPSTLDAVLSWADEAGFTRDLLFPIDDGAQEGDVSGVYLRHSGDMDAARHFLRHFDDSQLEIAYLEEAQRLPLEWFPAYAGYYGGRGGGQARMELASFPDYTAPLAHDAQELRARLLQAGYRWVNEPLLDSCMQLIEIGLPSSLQFDVRPDGSVSPTLSLTVSLEKLPHRASNPIPTSGPAGRILALFEELGAADDRCRLLRDACLARRVPARDGRGVVHDYALTSLPACAKLKWKAGELQAAKWYQIIRAKAFDQEADSGDGTDTPPSRLGNA